MAIVINKNLGPNLVAAAIVVFGLLAPTPIDKYLLYTGMFALSGALTNWMAIHMLFEKVPGFYGSGIIPLHFEQFKDGFHNLVMRELFTKQSVGRFFSAQSNGADSSIDFDPVIRNLNLDDTYDQLEAIIMSSSFGGMIGLIGGKKALEPMREPFKNIMHDFLFKTVHSPIFQKAVHGQIKSVVTSDDFISRIGVIVRERLDELTPQMITEIIQRMIREHLGWLVVWGAVIGGLIGLVSAIFI